MEEWGFVDDRELQGWKGAQICMTCQHFAFGENGGLQPQAARAAAG